MTITTLVPVPSDAVAAAMLAPRPLTLDGATVGIVCNVKTNGPELMSAIADLLREEFDLADVVGPVRTQGAMLPSDEQLADLAARCDVIITGLGDCGSCSACSVHVATDFERLGTPAVAICTTPFLRSGKAMAARRGMPALEFVMVEHPLSSLTPDELRERAKASLPQVLDVLGLGAHRATRDGERALTGQGPERTA
jgi:hypothetical protein